MLSIQSIFQEIRHHPEAFRLLMSIAAKGEFQGGWENERIAALTRDTVLARKIRRHGADETKHGMMFSKLLRKAGLEPMEIPPEADYCMTLERKGMGLPHDRLAQENPLSEDELLAYLVHSKITEERAAEEVDRLLLVFQDDAELAPTLSIIADDEINHLSYCHEELLRLSGLGRHGQIRQMLKDYARLEIAIYRDVSWVFVNQMAGLMGWGKPKQWLLKFGVLASYCIESIWTWRLRVALLPPLRPNAMGDGNERAVLQTDGQ